jgi:hypothetical protein
VGWIPEYLGIWDKLSLTRLCFWLNIALAMKKETKKDNTMTTREVGVLIEALRTEFKAFGDELKTISRRIEGIETTTVRSWEKLTEIDLRLIRLENKLDTVDKRLTAVESLK